MEPENENSVLAHQEAMRLMELVRIVARTLGFNNSSLARKAGVPLASLVRYFKGVGEPKLEFLLAVVRAIGLDVREFIELAYPELPAPTAARAKLDRMLGSIRPGRLLEPPPAPPAEEPKPEAAPLRREDIEKMLEDLRRDVREILEARDKTVDQKGKRQSRKTSER
ncbi:MAG TPA: helix-turn-helix domain-containing protein [Thermoanaerobaculia bacterium]|jgi:DNA-binding phage protein|nr:helix-turn-helix domain-containing protein [Thermoanaerobaculia bacterium]